jgi:protein CpxP
MKKTLILLAALAFATAGTSFAQIAPAAGTTTKSHKAKTPKSPAQKADRSAGKLAKELGLSAEQEAKVEQLMLARQQETAALKAKYGTNKKAGRPEMKAAHDRYEAQFKTILSPEQYAKFQQKKDEHHAKAKGGKMKVKAKA